MTASVNGQELSRGTLGGHPVRLRQMVARASADVTAPAGRPARQRHGGDRLPARDQGRIALGRWLQPGDEVTLSVERLGSLTSPDRRTAAGPMTATAEVEAITLARLERVRPAAGRSRRASAAGRPDRSRSRRQERWEAGPGLGPPGRVPRLLAGAGPRGAAGAHDGTASRFRSGEPRPMPGRLGRIERERRTDPAELLRRVSGPAGRGRRHAVGALPVGRLGACAALHPTRGDMPVSRDRRALHRRPPGGARRPARRAGAGHDR